MAKATVFKFCTWVGYDNC